MKNQKYLLCARVAAATLAFVASGLVTHAQVHGIGAAKSVYGPNGDDVVPRAHIGDVVSVRVTIFNLDTFGHPHLVTNVSDKVFHTSGTTDTGNLLPLFGGSFTLTNFGDSRNFDPLHTYVVAPNDPVELVDEALAVSRDGGNGLRYTATPQAALAIVHPAITVTKDCLYVGTPDNPLVRFSGVVSNAGDITLTNVTVVDDAGTPGNPADDTTFFIGTLAVGQAASFIGTNLAVVNPHSNRVVASAIDETGPSSPASFVRATNSCSANIPCTPAIQVTKSCPAVPPLYGTLLTYTGTVTNTGNVTLQNVIVVDDKPAPNTVVFGPATLAPGAGASFTGSYIVNQCPLATNTLAARGTANAICGSTTITNKATAICSVECLDPRIVVTKNCNLTGTPDSPTVAYSGIVSNAGNATLTNVVVIDNNGTPGNAADDVVHPIGTLAPHATAPYSGTYTAVGNPTTNTVVARGTDALARTVTDTAFCSVTIPCTPSIVVTKACPAGSVLAGTSLTFSGTVTNTGNVTLQNVTVVNDKPVAGTVVYGPVTLAPGAGASFTGSYIATNCPTSTDTLTASGTANTICGSQIVSSQASASCTVDCTTPSICVVKEVVCSAADGCESTWAKTATGVRRVDQSICPSFCYRISVTNCGTAALTNVTVLDNKVSLNGQAIPSTLAVGEGFSLIVSNVTFCKTTTNTVTATGQSATSGQTASANDSAIAYVKDAAIDCLKMVISTDGIDADPADNYLLLPGGDAPHVVTFAVRVSNIGDVDLTNVVINDAMLELAGCQPPAPFSLAAGASTTIELCSVQLTCANLPLTNVVNITADVDRGTNNLCVYDAIRGTNVSVSTSCDAVVACQAPEGCRTTGGGRQEKEKTFPRVRYVTHGGQVGASLGVETHFSPDSKCIKGEWEHVRHIQGGLRGNFHARTFDSLMCACLTCEGAIANKVGRLCNPNDRACGPEPRPAGANKLTFSGVGDYTLTNGRRTPRTVVFRVDIEDRSEPGGSHPKGGTLPADRYRIRMWILTQSELALLNSPDRLLAFREAVAASETNTPLKDGALKADGVTPVDLGAAAFGVRAPDIDDGGELDRGNRQIHPSLKACTE
jgi:uncharacterized repeat protein (TIGR01451 family)